MGDFAKLMSYQRAYFQGSVSALISKSAEEILGEMAHHGNFTLELSQRNAWEVEITILKEQLDGLKGHLFLEFDVPRIGSRIDVVLLTGACLIILEFKVGEHRYHRADYNQAWDYALDLKNFHEQSHQLPILPLLVATEARHSEQFLSEPHADGVYSPIGVNRNGIRPIIDLALQRISGNSINEQAWLHSIYKPTPTIIEAAQRLFSEHSVQAITQQDAGKINLAITSKKVEALIERAEREKEKVIVFVTGVPGAGKTLVGLNVATHKRNDTATHAVFLSGNGPLVAVLSEALTQDEFERTRNDDPKPLKGAIRQKVKAFIQNLHHFRDEGVKNQSAPSDRVVIFDEAQRAWGMEMTASFMARKKNYPGFNQSEPEFLISYLDRHDDWAVIVCLVGGGQEINRGEAGISTWLDAIREHYSDWSVYLSDSLADSEYAAGHAIEKLTGVSNVYTDPHLHLRSSMRSFRSENVSNFIKALLDKEHSQAREHYQSLKEKYPIRLSRDLEQAKDWIRKQARGSERYGMVASSGAQRLRPHAIDIRVSIDPCHWFLKGPDDIRSSYHLEDAATEFHVQGLELDWVCVTWDADLRFKSGKWSYHDFKGSKWKTSIRTTDGNTC